MKNPLGPRPASSPEPDEGDRLSSWKEIAAYLDRTVRTAQRWEQTEGLPVHRHGHDKRDSVYAFPSELDAWRKGRRVTQEPPVAEHNGPRAWRLALPVVLLLAAGGLGTWFFASRISNRTVMTAVPLTTYPGEEIQPALSPGGEQVAFSWDGEKRNNFDIYVKLVGPGPPLRLTTHPARDHSPAWSPDGHWIAFLRRDLAGTGKSSVYVIPAWGGPERRVGAVYAWGDRSQLSWSPDGKGLAVIDKESPNEPAGVFLLSVDTGEKRRLTRPPPRSVGDIEPAFSPDGRRLAFTRSTGSELSDLFILPLGEGYQPAGEPVRLTVSGRQVATPAWEPDGRNIVYVHSGASPSLWRISDQYPGRPEPLTFGEGAASVALPRRGRLLVYAHRDFDVDIWKVKVKEAPAPGSVLIHSTRSEFNPQYCPDGDNVAFSSDRTGNFEIWTCRSDGSGCAQLTSFGGPHTGTPRWSPDGTRIVFDSRPEGNAEIYVVGSHGGIPRNITRSPFDDIIPSWSPDGRWIYFSSNRSGTYELWKTPADGKGEAIRLTKDGGLGGFESADREFVYFFARSGVWRMPVHGGPETEVVAAVRSPHAWAVAAGGIYFVPPASGNGFSVQYLDFAKSRTKLVTEVARPWYPGLSVSPDGRSVLYCVIAQHDSDLMMVDGFR